MDANLSIEEPAFQEDDEYMLTTIDNPYNPFTQFEEWYAYDTQKGYHTCNYLARIAKSSNELSDEDQSSEILHAIDEIVKYNILGIYKKVSKKTFVNRSHLSKIPTVTTTSSIA